jgi:glutamate-1-semialdehyde 2,1-aminomutase
MPKADSPESSPAPEVVLSPKPQPGPYDPLEIALAAAKQRFVDQNPISGKLFKEAATYLPGGNTRSLLYTAPYPVCMKHGVRYRFQLSSEDGHTYVYLKYQFPL